MNIYQPYFYIIFFPNVKLRYAGIRFAKNCHPSELMIKYKTSSKKVHDLININEPFVIEQIVNFDDINELREYEVIFLKDKINDNHWLNQAAGLAIVLNDEQRESIRQKNIGKVLTENHKQKISKACRGYKHSEETKRHLSNVHTGKPKPKTSQALMGHTVSKETRDKISQTKKSKPRTQAEIDAHKRLIELNRGAKRSQSFCENQRNKTKEIWKQRTKEKLESIDLKTLFLDLNNGLTKKEICSKYQISRNFLSKHIIVPI